MKSRIRIRIRIEVKRLDLDPHLSEKAGPGFGFALK
jgi:hypothetical protein